jgi:signal transduction histidine kinase
MSAKVEPESGLDELIIMIGDQGCGIPAAELDQIFQPFRSSFEKGTGLGLAIVHRIVTDYSGSIQVSSTVGSGTTVRVRLPMRSPKPAVAEEAPVLTAGAAAV